MDPFDAAILAAGRGERLRAHGPDLPKPLVMLDSETLLARQARILLQAGARRVLAVVNSETAAIIRSDGVALPARLSVVVRDTPNSMETLFEFGRHIDSGRFLAATVDAIVEPAEMTRLVRRADTLPGGEGALGVVRWRGDERPLFVEVDQTGLIRKVGASSGCVVTAGVYFLPQSIFGFRARAREAGLSALRQFLGAMVEWGVPLHAVDMGEAIDIDVAEDLTAARRLIARASTSLSRRGGSR